jgi:hypothetical protein
VLSLGHWKEQTLDFPRLTRNGACSDFVTKSRSSNFHTAANKLSLPFDMISPRGGVHVTGGKKPSYAARETRPHHA